MTHFVDLPLNSTLQANLAKHQFVQPTPVQAQSIPAALAGGDLVVTAQTGTGKTLAFALPVLQSLLNNPKPGKAQALILSPTRELAMQIDETFAKLTAGTGVQCAVVVGGVNEQRQLQQIRKGARVLIATPGRFLDFLNRKLLKLRDIQIVVLDEADRMLDMGFLPAIQKILSALPAERQSLLYSATMESAVEKLVKQYLREPNRIAIGSTEKPAEQVDLHVYEVEQHEKFDLLEHMLREQAGSFLVFARTKHGADRLAAKLARNGSTAAAIHGNRTQNQRNQALRGFQEGRYRVLVATDVAARGIHVESIAHVVNYDLPQAPEDFIHRVGRTGRAGARGVASTFGTRAERSRIREIEKHIRTGLKKQTVAVAASAAS